MKFALDENKRWSSANNPEIVYRTKAGGYVMVTPYYPDGRLMVRHEVAAWLVRNKHELPEDLVNIRCPLT